MGIFAQVQLPGKERPTYSVANKSFECKDMLIQGLEAEKEVSPQLREVLIYTAFITGTNTHSVSKAILILYSFVSARPLGARSKAKVLTA